MHHASVETAGRYESSIVMHEFDRGDVTAVPSIRTWKRLKNGIEFAQGKRLRKLNRKGLRFINFRIFDEFTFGCDAGYV